MTGLERDDPNTHEYKCENCKSGWDGLGGLVSQNGRGDPKALGG